MPTPDNADPDDLNAKVLDKAATQPDCVRIRFTGMPIRSALPPAVAEALDRLSLSL